MHDDHHRCSHHRVGSRLEDGVAHREDHARWSRRDFLARMGLASLGLGFAVSGVPVHAYGHAPLLRALGALETNRVLVILQQSGGNDGLNMVVPVSNDIYYRARPTIAIRKEDAFLLNDDTGLHPAMRAGLEPLWDAGRLAVVHNVGYENSTRSHFEGTVNWVTGRDQGGTQGTGWAGRYLAHEFLSGPPREHPLAVRVGGASASLFLSDAGNLGVTFADAQQFEQFVSLGGYYDVDNVPQTVYGEALSFVRSVTNASFRYVESVQQAVAQAQNLYDAYPNGNLSQSLSVVARLIRGQLGARVYAVSIGGFDTHSNQGGAEGQHANRLGELANAVHAFYEDLAADGLDQQVLTMTFSEFGRTLIENGSNGTDHGAGAPMLLFGTGLYGGLYGAASPLTDDALYGGDPRFTTDYRAVYSTLLQDWFGLSEEAVSEVLGQPFDNLGFVDPSVGVRREIPEPGEAFYLAPNYPNPFPTATTIRYVLREAGPVLLRLFDVRGRLVATLIDEVQPAGAHTLLFTATGLASGTYLYRLDTAGQAQTRPMTLAK